MHGPRRWIVVLWVLACATAPACRADGFGGVVGIASDEVFRGLTQSDNQASPQVDLHYTLSGWYAGLSAVGVRRGADRSAGAGLIAYLGYHRRFDDDWGASVVLRYYDYPGYELRNYYNYEEAALSVSWRDLIVATVMASPNVFFIDLYGNSGRGPAYTYELGGRYPLPQAFSLNAGVGFYDLSRQIGTGYAYWSGGISKQWRSLNFDVRYVGTDSTARQHFEHFAENRVVLSALWLF